MATSWPTSARTDYAADQAFKTSHAQALVDRNKVLVQTPFALYFTEVTWTTTAAHTMFDWDLPVHAAIAGKTLTVYVDAKVTSGTGKVSLAIGGTGGTEVNVTATDYTKTDAITYTLPSSGTYDSYTATTVAIWAKAPAGQTIYTRGSNYLWCWITD